jgi:hypothetical protein
MYERRLDLGREERPERRGKVLLAAIAVHVVLIVAVAGSVLLRVEDLPAPAVPGVSSAADVVPAYQQSAEVLCLIELR